MKDPRPVYMDYSKRLLKLAIELDRIIKEELDLKKLDEKSKLDSERLDSIADVIQAMFNSIKRRFYGEPLSNDSEPSKTFFKRFVERQIIEPVQKQTDNWQIKDFVREFNKVQGVDPFLRDPRLNDAMGLFQKANVELITSIPEQHLNRIETIVMEGHRKGESQKTIAEKIREVSEVTKKRARFIARDQVSKLNGQLELIRATKNGITQYIWRSNRDVRLRPDHKELDGTVQEWAERPITNSQGDRNHPGEDYNCRCVAENIYPDIE
jgi:SPP1 gp7 family putative phage head morphogenesis protein